MKTTLESMDILKKLYKDGKIPERAYYKLKNKILQNQNGYNVQLQEFLNYQKQILEKLDKLISITVQTYKLLINENITEIERNCGKNEKEMGKKRGKIDIALDIEKQEVNALFSSQNVAKAWENRGKSVTEINKNDTMNNDDDESVEKAWKKREKFNIVLNQENQAVSTTFLPKFETISVEKAWKNNWENNAEKTEIDYIYNTYTEVTTDYEDNNTLLEVTKKNNYEDTSKLRGEINNSEVTEKNNYEVTSNFRGKPHNYEVIETNDNVKNKKNNLNNQDSENLNLDLAKNENLAENKNLDLFGLAKNENFGKEKGGITPEVIFEIYNANRGALPKAEKLTEDRRRKIIARLKDKKFPEVFENAVKIASQTPFLLGENDRGWKATFDFFIRSPSVVYKVVEGAYAGKRVPRSVALYKGLIELGKKNGLL